MTRIVFGAILGILVAYPALLAIVLTAVAALVSQPVVVAFAVGVLAWPHLARRVRGWTA